eukprot:6254172-Amphidinium_carterae.2
MSVISTSSRTPLVPSTTGTRTSKEASLLQWRNAGQIRLEAVKSLGGGGGAQRRSGNDQSAAHGATR